LQSKAKKAYNKKMRKKERQKKNSFSKEIFGQCSLAVAEEHNLFNLFIQIQKISFFPLFLKPVTFSDLFFQLEKLSCVTLLTTFSYIT